VGPPLQDPRPPLSLPLILLSRCPLLPTHWPPPATHCPRRRPDRHSRRNRPPQTSPARRPHLQTRSSGERERDARDPSDLLDVLPLRDLAARAPGDLAPRRRNVLPGRDVLPRREAAWATMAAQVGRGDGGLAPRRRRTAGRPWSQPQGPDCFCNFLLRT
jgi:hypothetical protein